jgi:hypothetical protein
MKKCFCLFFCFQTLIVCYSQKINHTITDSIKKNIDYDAMRYHSCSNFPTGIYTISFSLDEANKPTDFYFSIDSLALLKQIILSAIQKTNFASAEHNSSNKYLLVIYLKAFMHCNSYDEYTSIEGKNIWKLVAKSMDKMFETLEKTFGKIQNSQNYYLLPPLLILNKIDNVDDLKIDKIDK